MREKAIRWTMIMGLVSGLLWVGGLVFAMHDYFTGAATAQPPPAPIEQPAAAISVLAPVAVKEGTFRVLALGDSLTKGTGDPERKGYVGHAVADMKAKSGKEIVLENLGIDGQTSNQLAASLGQAPIQAQVKAADIILVSIGGNDLFRGGQAMGDLSETRIKETEDAYLPQLDGILKQLREHNPTARIFLIGLYNPFSELKDSVTTTKIVRDWNYKSSEIAAKYTLTVLVPTFDLFQLKVQDYLAKDLFHPNAAGYRLIGDRLASLITW
ncbi:GDSL-type esterase/lipase family protein [Paenibacillus sp. WQ 127069]|uniref:GDSL-type esterase/lipase family protein n=1 Tax=Paenibacillus baimaensis TaxID=2982185 RepID=A0ABT2UQW1_9BACL|nr:GDSL-type esterase/lipase family protein [Paenibacillus sp. WQ 127069]MCU6797044.1 GDSL-type esterase/lipase family protein [Paenibacillus sp. WQ 127069]